MEEKSVSDTFDRLCLQQMVGVRAEDVSAHNCFVILYWVRLLRCEGTPPTRANIARSANISRSVLTSAVCNLIAEGILVETAERVPAKIGPSSGGNKAVVLDFVEGQEEIFIQEIQQRIADSLAFISALEFSLSL